MLVIYFHRLEADLDRVAERILEVWLERETFAYPVEAFIQVHPHAAGHRLCHHLVSGSRS